MSQLLQCVDCKPRHHLSAPTLNHFPMNLTESLLHALKAHGAKQIFGIPGDFALPYFRII